MRSLLSGLWKLLCVLWSWLWGVAVLSLLVAAFWLGVRWNGGWAFLQETEVSKPPAADDAPKSPQPELSLPAAAVSRAAIRTAFVERSPAARTVPMVGMLEIDETRLEHTTAWTNGRVERQTVSITGETVVQGQILLELYSPELLRAHQELLEGAHAVALLDAEASEFMAGRARAKLESGREKLRQLGVAEDEIRALESESSARELFAIGSRQGGTVMQVLVRSGDHVKTGQLLYMVADLHELWLQLTAYESDLPWLRYGQTVHFEVESFPGRTFTGTIAFIHPMLDEQSRSVAVRVNVKNPDLELYPGMFARAVARAQIDAEGQVIAPDFAGKWICPMHPEIVADTPSSCPRCSMTLVSAEDLGYSSSHDSLPPLLVPAGAVLTERDQGVVYLVSSDSLMTTFRGRRLLLGPRVGEHYVIYTGLEAGDEVVVEGAFKIDSELQIRGQPSLMNLSYPAVPRRFPIDSAFLAGLRPLFSAYLELQQALAQDDLDAARSAFSNLAEADLPEAAELTGDAAASWQQLRAALLSGAQEGMAVPDLNGGREVFARVSAAMIELEARFGHPEPWVLHQIYCTMVGESWLQATPAVQNPYLGMAMPRCGDPAGEYSPRLPPAAAQVLPEALRRSVGALLERYLKISKALALDQPEAARAAGQELAEAWHALEDVRLEPSLQARWQGLVRWNLHAARELADAEGVQTARQWLVVLTRAMLSATELGFVSEQELGIYKCPMAFKNRGGIWIQPKGPVENPYFGAVMFDCGSFSDDLRPR